VPQQEANRRAGICVRCGWQRGIVIGCGGNCGALKDFVARIMDTQNLKTPLDERLLSCGICRCFNAIIVHIPLELQQRGLDDAQKEQYRLAKELWHCWKAEGL